MGAILTKYFAFAQEHGGITMKAKLAMKTVITSILAPQLPDSPENIEKVKKALTELLPGVAIPDIKV
jgi:hypothetical protein